MILKENNNFVLTKPLQGIRIVELGSEDKERSVPRCSLSQVAWSPYSSHYPLLTLIFSFMK